MIRVCQFCSLAGRSPEQTFTAADDAQGRAEMAEHVLEPHLAVNMPPPGLPGVGEVVDLALTDGGGE